MSRRGKTKDGKNKKKKIRIDRQTLLKSEMALLVVISVFAVTIAWFRLQNSARANELSLTADSASYIKVALEEGGPDVTALAEGERFIDINMPVFYNVETGPDGESQLAPGVSGELKLYITALSPNVTQCRINTESIPLFDAEDETLTEEEQEQLNKLLKGHIQFYRTRSYDPVEKIYQYEGLIAETEDVEGLDASAITLIVPLELQQEKEVSIYWVWFYEYGDIDEEGQKRKGEYYFDMERFGNFLTTSGKTLEGLSADEKELYYGMYYDYADTLIGLNVSEIRMHIAVSGLDAGGNNAGTPGT
ncbi:MAG: hypothetical protein IJ567_06740 [Lachnospiraceae bacterium]|nr:hypothetical protein [Lachnospiraceae bacterium]